jgi:hypothetical protein
VYVSETGPRLMRYDLENARQLPDLQCLPEGEREMFFAMDYGSRGRLYVSRGNCIDLINSAGRTTVSYKLEGHGWATLKAAADGRHLYIGNFFSGQLAKLELESGELIASADTGVERSLAGIAEYRGDDAPVPQVMRAAGRRRATKRAATKRAAVRGRAKPKRSANSARRPSGRKPRAQRPRRKR